MEEWYTTDETWSIFTISKTRETYAQNWVVRGHFHAGVSEQVQKAYGTVEYLMALAWYHYPLYDEAMTKLLGIFEMAVRLRCTELGISTTYLDKKEAKKDTALATLIDQLAKAEPAKTIKSWLHHVRKLRNRKMHPKHHSFMGGMNKRKATGVVNLLNLIFLPNAEVEAANEYAHTLRESARQWEQVLFVLNDGAQRILVSKASLHSAFKKEDHWVSIWYFRPVLADAYATLSEHRMPLPLVFFVQDAILEKDTFTGINLETEAAVTLQATSKERDQETFTKFQQDWAKAEERDQKIYEKMLNLETGNKVQELMYAYRWEND